MSKPNNFGIKIVLVILLLTGCRFHDPDLEHGDGFGGGYVLTELGCLVYSPWATAYHGKNVTLKVRDSIISSTGDPYTFLEQSLVFELHKDRTVMYRFRWGYDTSWLKNSNLKPGSQSVVFNDGSWVYNPDDSLLDINFKNQYLNLPSLHGKFVRLGSDDLEFVKKSNFDSVINGVTVKVTRIETLHYDHS